MMLVFEIIRWKNFLSYGNYFTQLNLAKTEMTLICGENGAGKTTFLDALTFCLFGKPFRNINIPQLPNSINNKDCLVECEFRVGNVKYLVRRGLNPKIFEIHKDGKLLDQDSKSKDYQKMFEEQILKMSYKAFCQVVILGSTNYVPFMRLPAADRRAIVESLLDISVFSSMNAVLKDRVSSNKDDLRTCETSVEILESKKETQRKYLEALEEKSRSSLEGLEEEILSNEKVRDSLSAVVIKGGNILTTLGKNRDLRRKKEQSISDMTKIRITLENRFNILVEETSILVTTKDVPCPSCGQTLTDEHREKEIVAKKEKTEEIRKALLDVESRIASERKFLTDNKLDNIEVEYDKFLSVLNEHRQKLAVAEKMIERLKTDVEKIKKSQQSLTTEQDVLDELEQKWEDGKKHYVEKQEEQKLLSSAQTVLKDSGIKTRIIKHYLPIMNKLINHYLACMDFFVQFNLDENFGETIKSRHRDEFTYASFSEGEKMRIDLALLLAWREVARLKNSTNCNLLVLDEVFDSSLDSTGMDEFMKLIKSLGKRCNIFVISHKTDQLTDKFQDILTFSKKNNFSRINQ
jgi:DNA repair exonuclease SbcCD ATPase subunit